MAAVTPSRAITFFRDELLIMNPIIHVSAMNVKTFHILFRFFPGHACSQSTSTNPLQLPSQGIDYQNFTTPREETPDK
jgi:hypothetical protein